MKWGLVPVGTVTATTIQSEGSIDGEERGLTTLCTVPLAYTLAAQANFIRSDVGKLDAYIRFFLHARSKKCAIYVPLFFSAISFLCISLLYETKDF